MNLFLLGATGGIGRHLVKLALNHGHSLTVFARSPEKLGITHDRLRAIQGDLFDADPMAASLQRHDAVLSSFGPATLKDCTLRRDFGRTLASALRKSGVRRFQLVSSALLFPDGNFVSRALQTTVFRRMLPDMAAMEAEVRQADLEWTIVRPPRLTNGRAKHSYRIADGHLPKNGFLISRADVAHFMMEETEKPTHLKQIVGIAN
ncbi:MAG: SDR family oxidoreductase [Verrucomicrobia bacterium]|nr:SDR family oxidoreductase [Verrucomicrobiota bacterium]